MLIIRDTHNVPYCTPKWGRSPCIPNQRLEEEEGSGSTRVVDTKPLIKQGTAAGGGLSTELVCL